jgi:RNA polymerase sigma-70 factor (ECF subfamily)
LLVAWSAGDAGALEQLVPLVHNDLRRIARHHMRGERSGHTLQPTALVHEAYLRLVDLRRMTLQNKTHFLAMAARLMRRVLVDMARSKRFQKRGGGGANVTFDEGLFSAKQPDVDILALVEALQALAIVNERRSRVIEMRFFGGLTVEDTAVVLNVSPDTVKRDWRLAKLWLLRELEGHRR